MILFFAPLTIICTCLIVLLLLVAVPVETLCFRGHLAYAQVQPFRVLALSWVLVLASGLDTKILAGFDESFWTDEIVRFWGAR